MDVLLIIIGTFMAMVNGTVLPAMCIVFGDMTDSFIHDSMISQINTSAPSECSAIHIHTQGGTVDVKHFVTVCFCVCVPPDFTLGNITLGNSTLQDDMQV